MLSVIPKRVYNTSERSDVKPAEEIHQHLTFLDWDDTIFPTTMVVEKYFDICKDWNGWKSYFDSLDALIVKVFKFIRAKSKIRIVTNGAKTWFLKTLDFLPRCNLLFQNEWSHLIISSRDLMSMQHPENILKWKNQVFKNCVIELLDNNVDYQHILSIGDSSYELNALLALSKYKMRVPKQQRYIKPVIFKTSPTLTEVFHQLRTLLLNIESIFQDLSSRTYQFKI